MAELPEGITQDEIDRFAQLHKGVEALKEELELLKTTLKTKYKAAGITGKRTLVYPSPKYGTVIVKLGEQNRILDDSKKALIADYPQEVYPTYWAPAINVPAIPASIVDTYRTITPTITCDVENANPDVAPRRMQS